VTAAVLTGRASFKAAEIIAEAECRDYGETFPDEIHLTTREKAQLVWPEFIPAVGTLGLSVTCIIAANRVGSRRAAAVTAAYAISEKAFSDYREKVVERLGEKKEREARDEVAQDRVNERPPSTQVVIVGNGDVLCFDAFSGRYFMSTMENIKKAMNDQNYAILNDGFASLTEFYDKLGLDGTSHSDSLGWNTDKLLDLYISTVLSDDGRPCISIDFSTCAPQPNFYKF